MFFSLVFLNTRRRLLFPHVFSSKNIFCVFFFTFFPTSFLNHERKWCPPSLLPTVRSGSLCQKPVSGECWVVSCARNRTPGKHAPAFYSTELRFLSFLLFFNEKDKLKHHFPYAWPFPDYFSHTRHQSGSQKTELSKNAKKNVCWGERKEKKKPQERKHDISLSPASCTNCTGKMVHFCTTVFQTYLPSLWHCRHK